MTYAKLKKAFDSGAFEPTIRHIRFPYFKNLTPYLTIKFDSPIIALVGANGSNKSSVLRALACCPQQQSIGEHWFSTDVDPIDESGGRPRYIFGYLDPHSKKTVEVIQSRISNDSNPDYWESSRPLLSDFMDKMPPTKIGQQLKGRSKTRWAGIKKKVEILDFRSEISAFDKLFYHGEMTSQYRNRSAKEQLRSRSKLLKKVISENLQSLKPFKSQNESIFFNSYLPQEQVDEISTILGRKYTKIRVIRHRLFESESYTAMLETSELKYSEAFAGSGEFSVVMLVHKVMRLPPKSLIILDEPEVSLHPGAQRKLMEFLFQQCLKNQHQVFLGTHSKHIVDDLPPEAIILLQTDPMSGKIIAEQNVRPSEAFFHLGLVEKAQKKIFVEDALAKEVVLKCLRSLGLAALRQFEVIVFPGGASSIFKKCITAMLQVDSKDSYFFLDGDQKPSSAIVQPENIPSSDFQKIKEELFKLTKISDLEFALDGGNDSKSLEKKYALERRYLEYALPRIYYLPEATPEEFVWKHLTHDKLTRKCNNTHSKQRFEQLTKLEKGRLPSELVTGPEILETQIRRLAQIGDTNIDLKAVSSTLNNLVE